MTGLKCLGMTTLAFGLASQDQVKTRIFFITEGSVPDDWQEANMMQLLTKMEKSLTRRSY